MLSQCPECRTVFRVRPEQLEAARGKVRCSRCQTVFFAALHQFHLPLPVNSEQAAQKSETLWEGAETPLEEAPGPGFKSHPESDFEPEPEPGPGPGPEPGPEPEPEPESEPGQGPVPEQIPGGASAVWPPQDAAETPPFVEFDLFSLFDPAKPLEEQDPGIDDAPEADEEDSPPWHDIFAGELTPSSGDDEPTPPAEPPSTTTTGDERNEMPDPPSAEAEVPPGTGGTSPSPDLDNQGGYRLPPQLDSHTGAPVRGTLLWGSGILLLILILALQYLYYQRINLAENPMLRPLLSQMCELTGCQLPLRRDVGRIELVGRLMQAHPRYRNSLLITATVVNRAEFTQPFPLFEVIMTDLQQKIIARRQFHPEQYLIGETGQWEFTPNTEIPLMLEVVDPGEKAVGFEFRFY